MNYNQAIERLEQLVSQIEKGNVDVDTLSEKLKEAKTLITFCSDILKTVEKDVSKILSEE